MSQKLNFFQHFLLLTFFLAVVFSNTYAQNSERSREILPVCVAFYNVENLFDTIHSSGSADEEYTPGGANAWNTQKYVEKLDRLAEVISKIGLDVTPDGPAVVGLSEIENEAVVWDLVRQERIAGKDYQVIFRRGRDRRVNNAFIYNPRYFEPTNVVSAPVIMAEDPDLRTRDHLVISGLLLGEPMHFIVAHWPSRSGGESRSRPRRIAAAQSARAVVDSLLALDAQAKIVFMGDLNDDPTDVSVARHLKAGGNKHRLSEGQLFNPFVELARKGIGSLAWRDTWNLFDQVIVSQGLLGDDLSTFRYLRAEVFNKPFLRQPSGRFQGYPFRTHAGGVHLGGYSDHFPTYVILIREVK